MYKLYPYFTNDGSVGLYSPVDDDIYHSTYGAATEAYEKFIFPSRLENFFYTNRELKVLDICYGIGYNSKSLVNFIFQLQKKIIKNNKPPEILSEYNDKLYPNKIVLSKINNETIYGDNDIKDIYNYKRDVDKISGGNYVENIQNCKIYIKALDTDKILAGLSPFFKNINNKKLKSYKPDFKNEKIEKYLNTNSKEAKYNYVFNFLTDKKVVEDVSIALSSLVNYPEEINIIFLDKIFRSHGSLFSDEDILTVLNNRQFSQYFNRSILYLLKKYYDSGYNYSLYSCFMSFLHNIYYNHITNRYKRALSSPLYNNLTFDLKINDARQEILNDKNKYNYIFLDAFTPSKCPCLWTVDFFKQLYNHLDDNGMVLTYSSSTNIRNAFINAGFYIGKIYNALENKFTGTIAVKNKALIEYELSEYDLGLLKTKAGIFYRDENLTCNNDDIIRRREIEVRNSSLLSSSQYIKSQKR